MFSFHKIKQGRKNIALVSYRVSTIFLFFLAVGEGGSRGGGGGAGGGLIRRRWALIAFFGITIRMGAFSMNAVSKSFWFHYKRSYYYLR